MHEEVVYAISACLLGVECRYDGRANLQQALIEWMKGKEYIMICPEVMGGMSTPRAASEIVGDRVINNLQEDVTDYFYEGAKKAIQKIKAKGVSVAILKSKSPSCGVGKIYDGSFGSKLIDGDGIFVREAKKEGIICYTFEDFYKLYIEKM